MDLWNLSLIDRSAIFIQEKGFEITFWIVKGAFNMVLYLKSRGVIWCCPQTLYIYRIKKAIAKLIHDMLRKMIYARQILSEKNDIFSGIWIKKCTIIKPYIKRAILDLVSILTIYLYAIHKCMNALVIYCNGMQSDVFRLWCIVK